MARNVALLRGINVGSRQRMAMADLRALLEGLGHTDVRTHLQSGNAVFTSARGKPAAVGRAIEEAITAELGMTVRVLVRTAAEMRAVVDGEPFGGKVTKPSWLMVSFLGEAPDAGRLSAIDPAEFAPEEFAVGDRVIYVWHPNGYQNAKLTHAFWEKRLKLVATARNWNTVTRLLELAEG